MSDFLVGRLAHLVNKRADILARLKDETMPFAHWLWKRDEALPMVETAIARLKAGTYGTCVGCREPIPENRLLLRPEVPCCVECQAENEEVV